MPNWCANNVTLSGDRVPELLKQLQAPLKLVRQEPGNWSIVESADGEEQKPHSYFFYRLKHVLPDEWVPGYDTNVKHIGSKWGVCDPTVTQEDDDYIHLHFSSAWGPCVKGFLQLCQYYELDMEYSYEESGSNISGETHYNSESKIVEYWKGSYAVGVVREDAPAWELNAERLKNAVSEFFEIELSAWDSTGVVDTEDALREVLEGEGEDRIKQLIGVWKELKTTTHKDVQLSSCTYDEGLVKF